MQVASDFNPHKALVIAAGEGDEKLVKSLIEQKAEINRVTYFSPPGWLYAKEPTTPLIEAAKHGHRKIVELLISAKADVNFPETNIYGTPNRPIFSSLTNGREKDCCTIALLQKGAHLKQNANHTVPESLFSPLMRMISDCDLIGIKTLFAYCYIPQCNTPQRTQYLHSCLTPFLHKDLLPIILGYEDSSLIHLAKQAMILANQSVAKITPLRLACRYGNMSQNPSTYLPILKILIDMGANFDYPCPSHEWPAAAAFFSKARETRKSHSTPAEGLKTTACNPDHIAIDPEQIAVIENLLKIKRELSSQQKPQEQAS